MTIALFGTWMSVWDRYLRILGEIRGFACLVVARNLMLYLPVGYLLLNNALDYQSFLCIISLQATIFVVAAICYFFKKYELRYLKDHGHEIWNYTRPMIPNKILAFSIQPSIIFAVSQLFPPQPWRYLFLHRHWEMGSAFLSQSILNALNPLIFKACTEGALHLETVRVLGTSIFYGICCCLIILLCDAPLHAYVPAEFSDVVPLFPLFVLYSWANFGKNVLLTYVMIDADRVRFVPVATYIFAVVGAFSIYVISHNPSLELVVGALITARSVSCVWLYGVSKRKKLTVQILLINYMLSSLMMLQVFS